MSSNGTRSPSSSSNHRSSRRKKRNHHEEGDDKKGAHKKQKYADTDWAANAIPPMDAGLPPPSAVKQEPAMMGHIPPHHHPGPHPLIAPPSHHGHGHGLNLNLNHNHNHHLPLHSPKGGTHSMMMNGISAPQPATMSLSGGNPMSFVNPNSVTFAPPPHLGGLPLPQFPPPHSMMDDGQRSNGSHPHHSPLPMANAPPNGTGPEHSNEADGPNGNLFPMNVTPSVMAGGPPLASM